MYFPGAGFMVHNGKSVGEILKFDIRMQALENFMYFPVVLVLCCTTVVTFESG